MAEPPPNQPAETVFRDVQDRENIVTPIAHNAPD
jgi:hypothetical protein